MLTDAVSTSASRNAIMRSRVQPSWRVMSRVAGTTAGVVVRLVGFVIWWFITKKVSVGKNFPYPLPSRERRLAPQRERVRGIRKSASVTDQPLTPLSSAESPSPAGGEGYSAHRPWGDKKNNYA
jgi:hypothetical protein